MRTEVEPDDWTDIDLWWSTYTQGRPSVRSSALARALETPTLVDHWEDLDQWWQTHEASSSHAELAESTSPLFSDWLTNSWSELDSWWEVYAEAGHETAKEIASLLGKSNEVWRQSAAPFDTDPLASAITRNQGPLLPSNEEGWSDWLAKLLRSSAPLVTELFDVPKDEAPENVIREDQLSNDEGGFRRPDLLLFHANRGISIEVKLGDEHYRKTEETARLAEHQYDDYEWHHTLLLPRRKKNRLKTIVDPEVSSKADGQPQVEWENPGPITVLYWRDVTAAIRTLLRRGDAVDDHWAANAYLFCAAAEQRIMNFAPQPTIEQIAKPASLVDETRRFTLEVELAEQLTYLHARQGP